MKTPAHHLLKLAILPLFCNTFALGADATAQVIRADAPPPKGHPETRPPAK